MKQIEIYTVGFSVPKLVTTCCRKDLANTLERLDLLGKCVMLRTAGDLHNDDVVEAVGPTPIERRPTLDELRSCCFVKVKNWDDLIKSGGVEEENGSIKEKSIYFADSGIRFLSDMKKFCGTTHKVLGEFPDGTSGGKDSFYLKGCGSYTFTPEMLTYVAQGTVR